MKPQIIAVTECIAPPINVSKHFAPQLRRADDYIKIAVAATEKIYSNPSKKNESSAKTGLFVGTAFGPMQTNFDVLGLIVDENQTSPTLFSHSVFNSAAGYIARLFNIPGSCFSFTDFSWPFFQALAEGYSAISSGRLDRCLVLQIESYSDLLMDARMRTGKDVEQWPQGTVAWHLAAAGSGTGWQLEDIEVNTIPASPQAYLHRREELHNEQGTRVCSTPLAAAASITQLIQEPANNRKLTSKLSAPYGSVQLTLHPSTT